MEDNIQDNRMTVVPPYVENLSAQLQQMHPKGVHFFFNSEEADWTKNMLAPIAFLHIVFSKAAAIKKSGGLYLTNYNKRFSSKAVLRFRLSIVGEGSKAILRIGLNKNYIYTISLSSLDCKRELPAQSFAQTQIDVYMLLTLQHLLKYKENFDQLSNTQKVHQIAECFKHSAAAIFGMAEYAGDNPDFIFTPASVQAYNQAVINAE